MEDISPHSIRQQLIDIIKERTIRLVGARRKAPMTPPKIHWESLDIYDTVDHIMDITGAWRSLKEDGFPQEGVILDVMMIDSVGEINICHSVIYAPSKGENGDWNNLHGSWFSWLDTPYKDDTIMWRYQVDPNGNKHYVSATDMIRIVP